MSNKVIRDGMVAVLYSPGCGAGWSTWAHGNLDKWAVFAPEVVEWVEQGKPGGVDGLEEIVKSVHGDNYFYCGGADDLEIEWVPVGTQFKIDEYDGSESVIRLGEIDFYVA